MRSAHERAELHYRVLERRACIVEAGDRRHDPLGRERRKRDGLPLQALEYERRLGGAAARRRNLVAETRRRLFDVLGLGDRLPAIAASLLDDDLAIFVRRRRDLVVHGLQRAHAQRQHAVDHLAETRLLDATVLAPNVGLAVEREGDELGVAFGCQRQLRVAGEIGGAVGFLESNAVIRPGGSALSPSLRKRTAASGWCALVCGW